MVADGSSGNLLWQLFSSEPSPALPAPVPVTISARQFLLEPGAPVLFVYFPLTAVVALMSTTGQGESAQVALVGREGLVGLSGVFGSLEGSTMAQVLVPGTAMRVPTAAIRAARASSASVRRVLDAYTQARLIQVAQAAVCNRLHAVEQRLSRWLLELHERVDGDELLVSHERIAELLGVHRPTVSTALQSLQQQGAITRHGRAITITNRGLLERRCCQCHQTLARDLERAYAGVRSSPTPTWRSVADPPDTDVSLESVSPDVVREIAGRLLLVSLREQEAREHAEAANHAKDVFLSTVSHDLRTPLNAILGWCAILQEHRGDDVERGLHAIERNARAQLALVNELLDSVRMSSGTLSLQRGPVSLVLVAQAVVDAVAPEAAARGVSLDLESQAVLEPLDADADRLWQVLLNVLQNALKFTPRGGSVHVKVDSTEGRARVVVRDTGIGIAPSLLPHVFERFRSGPTAPSAQSGLGLGLAISRAVVDLHGGTIVLESEGEGKGTTCTVELPFAPALAHASTPTEAIPVAAPD